jgi:FkbM family methyltransferase
MKKPLFYFAGLAARILPQPLKQALYRWPLSNVIRRWLNRAAPQGLTRVRVAGGALSGSMLVLDLQNEKDYWLGTYEPELQEAIGKLVEPGMVSYDIGANIGYISLLLAHAAGESGRVIAFEALPQNVARLRQNLALNGMEERVEVVHAAVTDQPKPVHFLVGPSSGTGKVEGSAGRHELHYSQSITVPGIALDDFVFGRGHPKPDMMKIDIEGGEVLAVPGMLRVLSEVRPVILMELHGPEAAQASWDALIACGYRVCRMNRDYPEVGDLSELDWKAYLVAFSKERKLA